MFLLRTVYETDLQRPDTRRSFPLMRQSFMSEATATNRLVLVEYLSCMVNELNRVRSGKAPRRQRDLPVLRWEDDDYIYLEIDFSGSPQLEADISVGAGRAVVRVVR
jgi:hypothetical protein